MTRPTLTLISGTAALCARPVARLLPGLLGVVLLVLQSVAPLSAHASNSANWVEICGEFGATLVQIDPDRNTPVTPHTPCKSCSDCVFCAAVHLGKLTTTALIGLDRALSSLAVFLVHQPDVTANAAQFWPDSRGPPRARPFTYQTANSSPMVHPRNSRRAPCI